MLEFVRLYVFPPSHLELLPVRESTKERLAYESQLEQDEERRCSASKSLHTGAVDGILGSILAGCGGNTKMPPPMTNQSTVYDISVQAVSGGVVHSTHLHLTLR